MTSEAALREWLEKLAALHEDYADAAARLNDAKREAYSDGLNPDALNAFLPVIVKHRHDKGLLILQEMARYARAYGAEVPDKIDPSPGSEPPRPLPSEPTPELGSPGAPPTRAWWPWPGVARESMQVVIAISVTAGLLWFLS